MDFNAIIKHVVDLKKQIPTLKTVKLKLTAKDIDAFVLSAEVNTYCYGFGLPNVKLPTRRAILNGKIYVMGIKLVVTEIGE